MLRMLLISLVINIVVYTVAPEHSTIRKAEAVGMQLKHALELQDVRRHVMQIAD